MQCPTCRKPVDASDDAPERKSFPFCSDRCKLIDLGKWLDGAYQIPVEPGDSESDELDEGPLEAWVDPRLKRREQRPSPRG